MTTYATWNPSDKNASVALSGGDLVATVSVNSWSAVRSTIGKSSGKWYWEYVGSGNTTDLMFGIGNSSMSIAANKFVGSDINGWAYYSNLGGRRYNNNAFVAYGGAYTTQTIGVALDMDGGTINFLVNGVDKGTAFSGLSGTIFAAVSLINQGLGAEVCTANFGATAFNQSVPIGYNAGLYTVSAPVADFSGTPLSGNAPLTVAFTDLSTGDAPTSWAWTFGDGGTSTAQNPSHVYASAGTYNVGLTATNSGGSNLATKNAYITVNDVVVATTAPSGGIVDLGRNRRKKTQEELAAEREKFGIPDEARIAIEEAARRQAIAQEQSAQDEQKNFEELSREFTLRGIEWDVRYLEAMNTLREKLIEQQREEVMKAKRDEEDVMYLLQVVSEVA